MSSPENLDWDLLKELECPICLEYMVSTISMCENGHNMCTCCRSKVSNCPSCKGEFIKGRNITLEKVAAIAVYPCKNREAGCKKALKKDNITYHILACGYQSRECPFRKLSDMNCTWTGALTLIQSHVKTDHGDQTAEHSGAFEVKLENFNTARRFCKAIFTLGKLFYLAWETTNHTFYFAVFCVGHKDEADQFTYDFIIGKQRDRISITGTCHSYLEAKSDVLRPGQCVTLHYRTVQKYVNQNTDLSCEIEIRQKCMVEVSVVKRRQFVATSLNNPAPSENADW
jgi:E3 ubiquitin-protein ligase SIAH1